MWPVRMNDRAVRDPPGRARVPRGLRARGPEAWATEWGQQREMAAVGGCCYKGF